MTILMPQSPGHWTEAVLLRLDGSTLEHHPLRVILDLDEDLTVEIEQEQDSLHAQGEDDYYYTFLRTTDEAGVVTVQTLLYEAPDIDILLDEVEAWIETYIEASFEVERFIEAAEAGEIL